MLEAEALGHMIAPGQVRPSKPYLGGIIQILVTSACDLGCYNCTQASQLRRKPTFMSPEHFEKAILSLKGYFGVHAVFGGNPCLSKYFPEYCKILQKHVPFIQRGLWSNSPLGHGKICRETFNPVFSNINVHLSRAAYNEWKRDWPECNPVGLTTDSRHSPCYVSMKDIGIPEGERWELISRCEVNYRWSSMVGMFRGELRAWFCEVAGAQAILHQDEADYPDTGLDPTVEYEHHTAPGERIEVTLGKWWQLPMLNFRGQVRKHCHDCSVPLKGHGSLAQAGDRGVEQVSQTHAAVFKPKQLGRKVELVTVRAQLGDPLGRMTAYLANAKGQ